MTTKLKGDRMKVGGTGIPNLLTPGQAAEAKRIDEVTQPPLRTARATAAGAALQSAVLQPALDALGKMPDIDHAKVAALRDALARGEVPFNPAKLAALIESHHGKQE